MKVVQRSQITEEEQPWFSRTTKVITIKYVFFYTHINTQNLLKYTMKIMLKEDI